MDKPPDDDQDDCGTCRRDFLQTAGALGLAVAFLGFSSADAAGLPVLFTEGTGAPGERRYPIPAADSVNIDRGSQVIVTRFSGQVYVFALACPHQNNPVKWVARDHRFQCTKHDSQYTPAGIYMAGRATRNLDRYVIRRDGTDIVVDLHRWVESDKDPKGWAAAAVAV